MSLFRFLSYVGKTHGVVCLRLLLVAHGDDGQHQVDQVEGAEEDHDRKKYHMDWTPGGDNLCNGRGVTKTSGILCA